MPPATPDHSARPQRGQALIEFAIILTLLVLLLAGGVELGTAAINSNQARQAAEQGGQQWSEVVGASGLYVVAASSPYAIGNGAPVPAPATVGLGDHSPGTFARPACDDLACTAPSNGLPGPSAALNPPINPATGALTGDLYLFNPLPIDVTSCVVNDAVQYTDCVNRIFDGCGPPTCPAAVAGLPRLNAALRGLYTLRCLNAADAQVACRSVASGGTAVSWLLRLPGRHDVAGDDTVRLALLDDTSNVTAEVPIFEIECAAAGGAFIDAGGNPCDTQAAPGEVCWAAAGTALACRVRVKVRYRHHFYALLASAFFDGDPLPAATAAALDLGEVNAAGVPVGGYGAEVTAQELASAAPRYFKVPWRTFQGCSATRTVRDGGSGLRGSTANCN